MNNWPILNRRTLLRSTAASVFVGSLWVPDVVEGVVWETFVSSAEAKEWLIQPFTPTYSDTMRRMKQFYGKPVSTLTNEQRKIGKEKLENSFSRQRLREMSTRAKLMQTSSEDALWVHTRNIADEFSDRLCIVMEESFPKTEMIYLWSDNQKHKFKV